MPDTNLNPDTQTHVFNATEIYEMGDPPPVNIGRAGSLKASILFGPEDSAPGENLFNAGMAAASSTPPPQAAAAPASASASTNIFDQGLGSSSAAAAPAQTANPTSFPSVQSNALSQNLFDLGLAQTNGPAASQNPENGQPSSDPNAGLLKKGWAWLNEPLIQGSTIQHALGMDPNDNGVLAGVERGGSNIAAGLTSPLSLLLTLGTFGAAGAVEGVGASLLREAGLSASELVDATKGANILKDALANGHSVDEGLQAVSAAGYDADKLRSALRVLDDSEVTHDALASENLFRNVTGRALMSAGIDAGDADTFSKYISAGVGAGFSVQQLHQAAVASPRVLDAIKDGDYGNAAQLATEALASGALGYAGARATIHEVGDLVPEAEAGLGLRAKPSEENRRLINEFGAYDADVARSARDAKLFTKSARSDYQEIADDPIRLHRVKNLIEANLDADKMADRFNSLARAAGRDEQIPRLDELVGSQAPERETIADTHAVGFAPERIAQLEREQKLKASYTSAEIDDLLSAYDSRELKPDDFELAKILKQRFDDTLMKAQQAGALKEGVDSYTTNLWEKPDNPALNRVKYDMQNGSFAVNTSMARQRAFANSYEGQLAGYKLKPEATDPITTAGFNSAQFAKIIAARQTLDRLQSKNVIASDGRPMLAPSGTGRALTNEDGQPLATLVNPDAVRSIRIAQPVIDKLRSAGDLQRFLDEGKIVQLDKQSRADRLQQLLSKQGRVPLTPEEQEWVSDVGIISGQPKPVYAWRPFDYKSGDSPVLRDWNFAASDAAGNPVTLLSELKIHPEAYDYLQRRLGGNESAIRKSPIGRAALGVAGELKGVLLGGLSPFHAVQTAGRALLAGVSPFVALDKWSLADPILYRAVEHGLTLPAGSDLRQFEDGSLASHSKLLSKIPILGPLQDSLNNFLFRDYIPSLKAKAFPAVLAKMREANPKWTEGKLFAESASYVNDLFGGQNWKRLGASAASEDFQKLFLLAPDWLRSEINLAARLVRPGQRVSQADVLKMTAGLWVAARAANMLLNNGQPHFEAPFAISTTDREGRQKLFSIRTLPTDLLHLVQDPRGFGLNRMSPLARTGLQVVTGRDEYGRKIPAPTFFGNLLANSLPISAQNIGKAISGEVTEVTNEDQVLKALGATVYPYKTEAGKLADQLASDRAPSGVIPDPATLRYHLAILHLEDQLRAGEISMADIAPAVQSGDLSVQDFHKISENFKKTYHMSQPMARLYVRAASLPLRDFLKVWEAATPSEHVTLVPLFNEKRRAYLKTLPASKRDTDPLARHVAAIFGR